MAAKTELHVEQLAALGHPVRLAILRMIVRGAPDGTSAGDIQPKLGIPASTLSHHLRRLSSAKLLRPRQEGTFVCYAADYEQLGTLKSYLWDECCKGGAMQ